MERIYDGPRNLDSVSDALRVSPLRSLRRQSIILISKAPIMIISGTSPPLGQRLPTKTHMITEVVSTTIRTSH